jgi:hypothetical protein
VDHWLRTESCKDSSHSGVSGQCEPKPVFADKKNDLSCYLLSMSPIEANLIKFKAISVPKSLQLISYPSFLKIHSSVLKHLDSFTDDSSLRRQPGIDIDLNKDAYFGKILSVEFNSVEDYAKDVHDYVIKLISKPLPRLKQDFFSILEKFNHLNWSKLLGQISRDYSCSLGINTTIRHNMRSIDIMNIEQLSPDCLSLLVHHLSAHDQSIHISIHETPRLLNYDARKMIQGGRRMNEAYHSAGLHGEGQLCGVADSGVHDLSCFFLDDSNAYPTIVTNRSGIYEPLRRKIVQYVGYVDGLDDRGGHGTHVVGSIAGKSNMEFSNMNGVAPEAKIAFFDVGMTDHGYLVVPPLEQLFNASYHHGARVHTNSWGNPGGIYGAMSYDLDQYVRKHPDFLVLFAAGNSGAMGLFTINSPANAKNALTVGALQLRNVFNDAILDEEGLSSVASFSSIGPTFDGRLKPDIMGPGDYIMSAYAGSPEILLDAQKPGWDGSEICSVHQMSGTSMATPLLAGTVLLVRQYFLHSKYWASMCNPIYKSCADGAFVPSGYLLKALMIHAGEAVKRYSDPAYDREPTFYSSFNLRRPPDVFQGYGECVLSNILPLLSQDNQRSELGLDPRVDLVIFDRISIQQNSTIRFDIDMSTVLTKYFSDDSGDDDNDSEEARSLPPIKVTVAWYDPPARLSSIRKLLLHDIDLLIIDPYGKRFWGNRPVNDRGSRLEFYPLSSKEHGNSSSIGLSLEEIDWSDDRNPQEQIHIRKPSCPKNSGGLKCIYKVFIHANALPVDKVQDIAIVITSAGVVHGSFNSSLTEIAHLVESTKHQNPDVFRFEENITYSTTARLGPEQNKTLFEAVSCDGYLSSITTTLIFEKLDDDADQKAHRDDLLVANVICPAALELTIVDPEGRAVAVGGADSSIGISAITTEWPNDWWKSVDHGIFSATVNVAIAGLGGKGIWKIHLFNAWSRSTTVAYNLTYTLNFQEDVDVLNYTKKIPSVKHGLVDHQTEESSGQMNNPFSIAVDRPFDRDSLIARHIPIPLTQLGIKYDRNSLPKRKQDPNYNGLVPDIVRLADFNQTGILHAIELRIDGYVPPSMTVESKGSISWLAAVAITAPNALMAQVSYLLKRLTELHPILCA